VCRLCPAVSLQGPMTDSCEAIDLRLPQKEENLDRLSCSQNRNKESAPCSY
jgi:hypothetical protein